MSVTLLRNRDDLLNLAHLASARDQVFEQGSSKHPCFFSSEYFYPYLPGKRGTKLA